VYLVEMCLFGSDCNGFGSKFVDFGLTEMDLVQISWIWTDWNIFG
jgi:hypothetical protein